MQKDLQTISKWGKFLGYVMIVMGALSALSGLFAFLVGAIPGIIMIFLGLYLLRSAKQADVLLRQYDEYALSEMLSNYAKFLKLNGIYMIVSLVLVVLMFVGMFVFGLALGGLADPSYYY